MSREPLFDASIDSRPEAKTSQGIHPLLIISVAETALLNVIAWFGLICYAAGYWMYPQSPLEVWFRWAPEAARHWLVKLAVAVIFATPHTIYPLMLYTGLPGEWKRRVPLRFLPYGSPPLLGAAILVIIAALPFVFFVALVTSVAD